MKGTMWLAIALTYKLVVHIVTKRCHLETNLDRLASLFLAVLIASKEVASNILRTLTLAM